MLACHIYNGDSNLKQWFPFTDYDFYGYLACGLVLLFTLDYLYGSGQYIIHNDWTFLQGALITAVAYITGQIVAIPSSLLLEDLLARKILRSPSTILMSNHQTCLERWILCPIAGRHYAPLPNGTRSKIFENAEKQTGLPRKDLEKNVEEFFLPAFTTARTVDDARERMDNFRNQYGFNRNMALSGFISAILLFHCAWYSSDHQIYNFAMLALILSFGMLTRFLKFYSSFSAEVLRTYAFQKVD